MESTSVFGEYLIWKAIGLGVLVFVVSFLYRVRTGRSLAEDLNAKAGAQRQNRPPADQAP
jgi:heme exporter protein D